MNVFPKIAEMRAQVAAAKADQERKIREEKCRMMSATISELCEIVSKQIQSWAAQGYYSTSVTATKYFPAMEKDTLLFCLKKVSAMLHTEGYTVKLDTNCKITVSWKWEEE